MTLPRATFTRGIRGYASLVTSIQRKPCTAQQLMKRFKITERQLLAILRQLRTLKVIYVKAWQPTRSGERNFARVWAFNRDGSHEDAPVPVGESGRAQATASTDASRPGIETIAFKRILEALGEPQTAKSLSEEVGSSRNAIYRFLAHAKQIHLVHIADWETNRDGPPVPMFKIGSTCDTPKPQPPSNAERCLKYMQNRRAREADQRVNRAIAGTIADMSDIR